MSKPAARLATAFPMSPMARTPMVVPASSVMAAEIFVGVPVSRPLVFQQIGDPVRESQHHGHGMVRHGDDVGLPGVGHDHVALDKPRGSAENVVKADPHEVKPAELAGGLKGFSRDQTELDLGIGGFPQLLLRCVGGSKFNLREVLPQVLDEIGSDSVSDDDFHEMNCSFDPSPVPIRRRSLPSPPGPPPCPRTPGATAPGCNAG